MGTGIRIRGRSRRGSSSDRKMRKMTMKSRAKSKIKKISTMMKSIRSCRQHVRSQPHKQRRKCHYSTHGRNGRIR